MNSVFDGCKRFENERCIQLLLNLALQSVGCKRYENEEYIQQSSAGTKERCKRFENERCIQQVDGYAVGMCGIRCAKMKGTYSKASV